MLFGTELLLLPQIVSWLVKPPSFLAAINDEIIIIKSSPTHPNCSPDRPTMNPSHDIAYSMIIETCKKQQQRLFMKICSNLVAIALQLFAIIIHHSRHYLTIWLVNFARKLAKWIRIIQSEYPHNFATKSHTTLCVGLSFYIIIPIAIAIAIVVVVVSVYY